MWTLIKAVLRFFKNSKLSLIGLLVLIFFSSSIFTVLNNTTVNLNESYSTISTQGNLHDFVINENFTKGNGTYTRNTSSTSTVNGTVDVSWVSSDSSGTTLQFTVNTAAITATDSSYRWTGAYESVYNYYRNDATFSTQFLSYTQTFSASSTTGTSWANTTSATYLTYSGNETEIDNLISSKQTSLSSYVDEAIEGIYINDLETSYGVSLRNFTSINVNNTKQGIFFKVIEYSPSYEIDKLVYYSGNPITESSNFTDTFTNLQTADQNGDTAGTLTYSRQVAQFLAKASWTDSDYTTLFTNLWTYLEANPTFNPWTDGISSTDTDIQSASIKIQEFVNQTVSSSDTSGDNGFGYNDKGYRILFSLNKQGSVPVTGTLDDFSTYEGIISPNYLESTGKEVYPNYDEWTNHLSDTQEEFLQWFQTIDDIYKFQIDSNDFLILGTGVSPDFMYPIVSFSSVVPNPDSEQVIYTSTAGYDRVYDGFRGNDTEIFLVGKFASNDTDTQATLDAINATSTEYMSWPANINAAYMADDTTNTITPTALRLQFIPQIVNAMGVVSAFLTVFVLALSVFISIVIIQRFIQVNRNSLGIMQANGYRKREIVFALCLLIAIPVFFASVLGYIIGFVLQGAAIDLLGTFWTIPTSISAFSAGSLFGLSVFLVALFSVITIFFSLFSLRGETSEFMKDEAKYKMSRVAHILKKPFGKFGIITRFRSAIAFSSIWRLVLLSLMSSVLMIALTFSFNIVGKFRNSSEATYSPKQYTYSLNLVTPTLQAGQYYAIPYGAQGRTLETNTYFNTTNYPSTSDSSNLINQGYLDSTSYYYTQNSSNQNFINYVTNYGNYQLPSMVDTNEQTSDVDYLKNKTSIKGLLNFSIGFEGTSLATNPWDLAESMMPSNNSNYANNAYSSFFEQAIIDTSTMIQLSTDSSDTVGYQTLSYRDWLLYYTTTSTEDDSSVFLDALTNTYRTFDSSMIVGDFNDRFTLNGDFVVLMLAILGNSNYASNAYGINYNKLVINPTDEPYSYVSFTIDSINGESKNYVDSLTATGIDPSTRRLALVNNSGDSINSLLSQASTTTQDLDWSGNSKTFEVYPMIINAYAARQYGLSIGDTVKVNVSNSADRYSRAYYEVDDPVAYFKVVDITTTYQGSEFYIDQFDANKILGLSINNISPALPTSAADLSETVDWSNSGVITDKSLFIWNQSGFNGVFSTDITGLVEVTNGVSLYAPSGLYIGTDKISSDNSTAMSVFSTSGNLDYIAQITGFSDLASMTAEQAIEKVSSIFGTSASFTILTSANSKDATLTIINSVSVTASNIQDVVLAIIIIISIIIVVIISSIIINDSIKLAAILKCLGYSDRSNAASFLSVYFPVFILGLIIAIPLTLALNALYIEIIYSFANVLLVISGTALNYVYSALGLCAIFAVSYYVAWLKIKKMDLTRYIK